MASQQRWALGHHDGCSRHELKVVLRIYSLTCAKIVGENGTVYDANDTTTNMARVNGRGGKVGYFTAKGQEANGRLYVD